MASKKTSDPSRWASIRKRQRGDGSMSFTVLYWQDGKQSPLTFRDEPSAEAFKLAIKAHGVRRALEMHGYEIRRDETEAPGMTVAEWCRRYIDHLTGVEQYTVDKYEEHLRQLTPLLGAIPLAALSAEDIAMWVKEMETVSSARTGRIVKPKTIANRHGFLSGALNAAIEAKLIGSNPCAGRRLPRTTGDPIEADDEAERRMLTDAEFDALLDRIIDAYKPMVRFMVASGFRWGEVSALKPGDVDRDEDTVIVRRAWKYSSKGYRIGPPKTKRSRRLVNIDPHILNALDYTHEYLFTNRDGGPVRYPAFRRMWDRAVDKAKLTDNPTPHCLRHTCGSWMLADGVPLLHVSRHLGHENVSVTADIYGHVDRTSFKAAADVMGKRLAQ